MKREELERKILRLLQLADVALSMPVALGEAMQAIDEYTSGLPAPRLKPLEWQEHDFKGTYRMIWHSFCELTGAPYSICFRFDGSYEAWNGGAPIREQTYFTKEDAVFVVEAHRNERLLSNLELPTIAQNTQTA